MNKNNKINLPEFLAQSTYYTSGQNLRGGCGFTQDCSIACQTGLCGECMASRQSSVSQDEDEGYNTRPGASGLGASGAHADDDHDYEDYDYSSSNSSSSSTSYPPNLSEIDPDKLTTGTVIIKREDGTTESIYDCPKYEGAFYDPDTGQILGDTHGPQGQYGKDEWNKEYDSVNNVGYFTEKPKNPSKKPSGGGSGSGGGWSSGGGGGSNWRPLPPPPPPKIEWNEPFPAFTGDLKKIYRYVYHLGVDEAIFSNVIHEPNSVCVTPLIEVGQLEEENSIALEAFFKGNIEFYIIDGALEIPILPLNQTQVEDEKLFYGLPTRFIVNDQAPILVKQNDVLTDCDYQTVLNDLSYWQNDVTYHISYTPIAQYNYKPTNTHIQIKAIIRGIGSIQKMTLRYYGDTYYKSR